jgi:hypothetical protein
MAKGESKTDRIDPAWPGHGPEDEHPVSELASDRQGSLSPFGEDIFPVPAETLSYRHPVTIINR